MKNMLMVLSVVSAFQMIFADSGIPAGTQSHQIRGAGSLIGGISCSTVGAVCLYGAGYEYIWASKQSDRNEGKGIANSFGTIFLISGLALEAISIPLYHQIGKLNKKEKTALSLDYNPSNNRMLLSYHF
jgi:hypothetical protein